LVRFWYRLSLTIPLQEISICLNSPFLGNNQELSGMVRSANFFLHLPGRAPHFSTFCDFFFEICPLQPLSSARPRHSHSPDFVHFIVHLLRPSTSFRNPLFNVPLPDPTFLDVPLPAIPSIPSIYSIRQPVCSKVR
jgi:hypothetical protein